MSFPEIVLFAAGTATLLAAGTGLAKLARALWRGAQRVSQLMDDWHGEPARPGVDPRPGVLERLGAIEDGQREAKTEAAQQRELLAQQGELLANLTSRVRAMEKELHPNGGGTFRDRVDRALDERGRPKVEAGGLGFQAERAFEPDVEGVRLTYGFIEQHSR